MKSFRRRTLVTIETERRLVIAQHDVRRYRCEVCGEQVHFVVAPESDTRSQTNVRKVDVERPAKLLPPSSSNEEEQTNAGEE